MKEVTTMKKGILIGLCIALCMTSATMTVSAWSSYYADAQHTSYTSDEGPDLGFVFLKKHLSSTVDAVSYPLVDGGNLYLYNDGYFICMDAITGDLMWEQPDLGGISQYYAPTIYGDYLYIPDYITPSAVLNKVDIETGDIIWTKELTGFLRAGPTVNEDKIVIGIRHSTSDKRLYCFDLDGNQLWEYVDSGYDFFKPIIANNKVYVLSKSYGSSMGTHYLTCLDSSTGDVVWAYTSPPLTAVGINPVLDGDHLYVRFGPDMYCFDANGDGSGGASILWQRTFENWPTQPAVANGDLFLIASKTLYRVDGEGNGDGTTDIIWSHQLSTSTITTFPPAIAHDQVYCGFHVSGPITNIVCVDTAGNGDGTTDIIWQQQSEEFLTKSQIALVDNRAWVILYSYDEGGSYIFGFTDTLDTIPSIEGEQEGNVGQPYTYTLQADLPTGEGEFQYFVDWGDGTDSYWIPQYGVESGEEIELTHKWDEPGEYLVRVRIRESEFGLISMWTELPVEIHRLEISSITGGFGVSATIRNVGDIGKDVEWRVEAVGGTIPGFHFKRSVNDTFEPLNPGTSQTVSTGPFFGLGRFKIMVSAECAGEPIVEETVDAFIFFVYTILR